MDQATAALLQAADSDGVFQLHSKRAKWLLSQMRPVSIEDLARVTALDQISHGYAETVSHYLRKYHDIVHARGTTEGKAVGHELPFLFQEDLMCLLRRFGNLEWTEAYSFIQTAAKGRLNECHPLWKTARNGMNENCPENATELLARIAECCRWAVCRSHHIANALTSFKAAYFRTHHRTEFEQVWKQNLDLNSRNAENDGG